MAVEFVSVADSGYAGRTGSVSVSAPAGVEDGDLLLMMVVIGYAGAVAHYPVTPTGWTPFAGSPSVVSDSTPFIVTSSLYWRSASSEPAGYTVDYEDDLSLPSEAVVLAYRGAASGAPAITIATGTGSTTTIDGMTAAADGARFVMLSHNWNAAGGYSPPGGTDPVWEERLDASGSLIYVADGALDAGQASGDDSHSNGNGAAEPWTAALVALEPEVFEVSGDLIATESGDDTAAIAGAVLVQGDLSASEAGADTAAIEGVVLTTATGAIAATETGADTAAIAGQIIVTGLINATETGRDTVVIRETAPSYSEVFAYEVAASDLTYTASASDLRYEVGTGDMRYEVAASDLRFTIPAR